MDSLGSSYQQFATSKNSSSYYTTSNLASAMAVESHTAKGTHPPKYWELIIDEWEDKLNNANFSRDEAAKDSKKRPKDDSLIEIEEEHRKEAEKAKKVLEVLKIKAVPVHYHAAKTKAAGIIEDLKKNCKIYNKETQDTKVLLLKKEWDAIEGYAKQLNDLQTTAGVSWDLEYFEPKDIEVDRELHKWPGFKPKIE